MLDAVNPDLDEESAAIEAFYDLFLDADASFSFEVDHPIETGTEVALSVWLPEAVMEGMRHLDEWPQINTLYENDSACLHSAHAPSASHLSATQSAILGCADAQISLADPRLTLAAFAPWFAARDREPEKTGAVGGRRGARRRQPDRQAHQSSG